MKLIGILKKVKGDQIKIETKENLKIEGKLQRLDSNMNIRLTNAKIFTGKESETSELYSIRGTSIRYIIFDDNIDFGMLMSRNNKGDKLENVEKKKKKEKVPKLVKRLKK